MIFNQEYSESDSNRNLSLDFGEPCGSQLAVGSLERFNDSNARVAVLATMSCRRGSICENFVCKKLMKKLKVAMIGKESRDVWKNVMTVKKPSEFHHRRHPWETQLQHFRYVENHLSEGGIEKSISTSLAMTRTRKSFPTFGSFQSEVQYFELSISSGAIE